jgi:hypothetical protein
MHEIAPAARSRHVVRSAGAFVQRIDPLRRSSENRRRMARKSTVTTTRLLPT